MGNKPGVPLDAPVASPSGASTAVQVATAAAAGKSSVAPAHRSQITDDELRARGITRASSVHGSHQSASTFSSQGGADSGSVWPLPIVIRGARRTGKTTLFHALQGRLHPDCIRYAFAPSSANNPSAAAIAEEAFSYAAPGAAGTAAAEAQGTTESTPELQSSRFLWRPLPPESYFSSAAGAASPFGLLASAAAAAAPGSVPAGFCPPSHSHSAAAGVGAGAVDDDSGELAWAEVKDLVETGIHRLLPAAALPAGLRAAAAFTVLPSDPRHPAHPSFTPDPDLSYCPWYVSVQQQHVLAGLLTAPFGAPANVVSKAAAAAAAVRSAPTVSAAAAAALAAGAPPAAVAAATSQETAREIAAQFDPSRSFQSLSHIPPTPLMAVPSVDGDMLRDPYHGVVATLICVDPRRADSVKYCEKALNAAAPGIDVAIVIGFRDCRRPEDPAWVVTAAQMRQAVASRPRTRVIEVSLRTGFGLPALHSFLALPFHRARAAAAHRRLLAITRKLSLTAAALSVRAPAPATSPNAAATAAAAAVSVPEDDPYALASAAAEEESTTAPEPASGAAAKLSMDYESWLHHQTVVASTYGPALARTLASALAASLAKAESDAQTLQQSRGLLGRVFKSSSSSSVASGTGSGSSASTGVGAGVPLTASAAAEAVAEQRAALHLFTSLPSSAQERLALLLARSPFTEERTLLSNIVSLAQALGPAAAADAGFPAAAVEAAAGSGAAAAVGLVSPVQLSAGTGAGASASRGAGAGMGSASAAVDVSTITAAKKGVSGDSSSDEEPFKPRMRTGSIGFFDDPVPSSPRAAATAPAAPATAAAAPAASLKKKVSSGFYSDDSDDDDLIVDARFGSGGHSRAAAGVGNDGSSDSDELGGRGNAGVKASLSLDQLSSDDEGALSAKSKKKAGKKSKGRVSNATFGGDEEDMLPGMAPAPAAEKPKKKKKKAVAASADAAVAVAAAAVSTVIGEAVSGKKKSGKKVKTAAVVSKSASPMAMTSPAPQPFAEPPGASGTFYEDDDDDLPASPSMPIPEAISASEQEPAFATTTAPVPPLAASAVLSEEEAEAEDEVAYSSAVGGQGGGFYDDSDSGALDENAPVAEDTATVAEEEGNYSSEAVASGADADVDVDASVPGNSTDSLDDDELAVAPVMASASTESGYVAVSDKEPKTVGPDAVYQAQTVTNTNSVEAELEGDAEVLAAADAEEAVSAVDVAECAEDSADELDVPPSAVPAAGPISSGAEMCVDKNYDTADSASEPAMPETTDGEAGAGSVGPDEADDELITPLPAVDLQVASSRSSGAVQPSDISSAPDTPAITKLDVQAPALTPTAESNGSVDEELAASAANTASAPVTVVSVPTADADSDGNEDDELDLPLNVAAGPPALPVPLPAAAASDKTSGAPLGDSSGFYDDDDDDDALELPCPSAPAVHYSPLTNSFSGAFGASSLDAGVGGGLSGFDSDFAGIGSLGMGMHLGSAGLDAGADLGFSDGSFAGAGFVEPIQFDEASELAAFDDDNNASAARGGRTKKSKKRVDGSGESSEKVSKKSKKGKKGNVDSFYD